MVRWWCWLRVAGGGLCCLVLEGLCYREFAGGSSRICFCRILRLPRSTLLPYASLVRSQYYRDLDTASTTDPSTYPPRPALLTTVLPRLRHGVHVPPRAHPPTPPPSSPPAFLPFIHTVTTTGSQSTPPSPHPTTARRSLQPPLKMDTTNALLSLRNNSRTGQRHAQPVVSNTYTYE